MDNISLARSLLALPSISNSEDNVAAFIEAWLKEYTRCRVARTGKNIIASLQGAKQDSCILLNGHIDTVAAGNRDLWQSDPFTLIEKDGYLYGLGASDMKGAVAAMLTLLAGYSETPPCDIYAMFVVEEETTGAGTVEALEYISPQLRRYHHVAGVIGEPTELGVALGHRGNAFVELCFTGKGGHGSRPPAENDQAAMKAHNFITSISTKQAEWSHQYRDDILGTPSIALTGLFTGRDSSKNQVPTECTVLLDIRTIPSLHHKLEEKITAWANEYGGEPTIISPNPAGYCAPGEPIAQVAMKLANQTEPATTPGATDQCAFTARDIPAIICGPGTRGAIHTPNEYIRKDLLESCTEHYRNIITGWCEKISN